MSKFEILILGSSSALPAFGRHPASQLVHICENYLLIDCGEGTQSRLVQYGQKLHRINYIFISHLHGDHYFGLPGVLTSLNLLGRKEPLYIYCLPGLEELIAEIVRLGQGEMRYTIHWQVLTHTGIKTILDHKDFEVKAFPLRHRIPTYGFIVGEKPSPRKMKVEMLPLLDWNIELIRQLKNGQDSVDHNGKLYRVEDFTEARVAPRKYAYASDTKYTTEIVPFLQDIDLLYHESTYMQDLEEKAHENFHSTAQQAAQIALQAGVKKLMLGHFSSRYKTLDGLLQEAITIFPNTELALEGNSLQV